MSPLEILLFSMAGLFLLGIPIFMALAASSCITLLCTDILPLSIIHNSLFDGLNIFPLLAVPSFVVAGTLMEYGNITNQIITVVKQIVGRSFGGLGICTILACTFFCRHRRLRYRHHRCHRRHSHPLDDEEFIQARARSCHYGRRRYYRYLDPAVKLHDHVCGVR